MKRRSHRYRTGYKASSFRFSEELNSLDIPDWKKLLAFRATPYTAQHLDPILHLIDTVENIIVNRIPGDFVECGVWMGGSCVIIAEVLKHYNETRTIWMYDTYDGVPIPGEHDLSADGRPLKDVYFEENRLDEDGKSSWCYSSLEHVQANMAETQYTGEVKFIQGLVEHTIPDTMPEQIALLRIDVDLLRPTKWILTNMFPLLETGGHLIADDYGHFPSIKNYLDAFLQQPMTKIDHNVGHFKNE